MNTPVSPSPLTSAAHIPGLALALRMVDTTIDLTRPGCEARAVDDLGAFYRLTHLREQIMQSLGDLGASPDTVLVDAAWVRSMMTRVCDDLEKELDADTLMAEVGAHWTVGEVEKRLQVALDENLPKSEKAASP